jgi:hypothetical protein
MVNKNNNTNKGTAIWIDEIGAIKPRIFTFGKENKENKTITLIFGKNEAYAIKKSYIRAKRIVMYKKSDGNVIAQNPDQLGQMDLNKKGIKTLRFNLQNSALQESKSAIYRWTMPKDIVDKLGPIFKLLFICIAVGVIGWAAFKYAGLALEIITRSRIMDCSALLPNSPAPIGIINNTIPIGA